MDDTKKGTYSFGETADIGQEYVDAYNAGVGFTMNDPVIIVDTDTVVKQGFWSKFPGLKLGLGIGGGVLLIGGAILAVILLRMKASKVAASFGLDLKGAAEMANSFQPQNASNHLGDFRGL